MRLPRVLFIDQSSELGGAELSLLDIACYFRETSLVALFTDGPFRALLRDACVRSFVLESSRGLAGVRRGSTLASSLAIVGTLARVVVELARYSADYDLIYANTQKAFVVGVLAGVASRRSIIWHLRDILCTEHFGRGNLKLVIALARLPHVRVIANSYATAAAFIAAGGLSSRITVIPNGIDSKLWLPVSHDEVNRLRQEFGLEALPIVGLFGRLTPWKGQHVFLNALAQLPNVQGLIVGEALFGQADYRQALEAKIRALGLTSRVRLAGFRADIPALMQLCDLVVHTSTAPEPFGRVIVEAMLSGRPVIASNAGGAAEIVEHGRSGILIAPGDPRILADWIQRVLSERRLAQELAAAGHCRAISCFALEATLTRIDEFVRGVVGGVSAKDQRARH